MAADLPPPIARTRPPTVVSQFPDVLQSSTNPSRLQHYDLLIARKKSGSRRSSPKPDDDQGSGTNCQFVHVDLTQHSQISMERLKRAVPCLETRLDVGYQHYEQWARLPARRSGNPPLLRGIQQLRSRIKREELEAANYALRRSEDDSRNFSSKSLSREKSNVSKSTQSALQKQRSFVNAFGENAFSRALSNIRRPLTPTAHVIDAEKLEEGGVAAKEKDATATMDRYLTRELSKPRIGISRLRDRCPMPVSVNQPRCTGDHVFLINEPVKSDDFAKSKQKLDSKPITTDVLDSFISLHDETDPDEEGLHANEPLSDTIQGPKTNQINVVPRKVSGARVPASVSSAELCDFSQLSSRKIPEENRLLDRQKTDTSVTLKGHLKLRHASKGPRPAFTFNKVSMESIVVYGMKELSK